MMSFLRVLASVLVVLNMASGFHIHGLALRQQLVGGRGQRTAATTSRRQRATESHGMAEDRAKEDGTSCRSLTRGDAVRSVAAAAAAAVVVVAPHQASSRKPGVNRPDLLPKEATNVIDLVGMLTKGQTKRINKQLGDLEEATGYRLRLLCQKYPETPGLAVKDYWKVDDKTIVMVVDPGEDNSRTGGVNILNFNVGDGLRLSLPPQFWQRLQNRYGNRFYVRDNGQDGAIISAVDSINLCLRSESGFCVDPPDIVKAANDQAVLQSIGKGGR